MKMEAGEKLYRRNPRHAPQKMSMIISTFASVSEIRNQTARANAAMEASPAAMPSMPSIRLNALVTPRTQTIVSGSEIQIGSSNSSRLLIPALVKNR